MPDPTPSTPTTTTTSTTDSSSTSNSSRANNNSLNNNNPSNEKRVRRKLSDFVFHNDYFRHHILKWIWTKEQAIEHSFFWALHGRPDYAFVIEDLILSIDVGDFRVFKYVLNRILESNQNVQYQIDHQLLPPPEKRKRKVRLLEIPVFHAVLNDLTFSKDFFFEVLKFWKPELKYMTLLDFCCLSGQFEM
eukprot:Awhi_evm1s3233